MSVACGDLLQAAGQLSTQRVKRGRIGTWPGTHDKISSQVWNQRENITPHDFPKPSLQAIPLHNGTPVLRNNDTDPRMTQKGSEEPNLEMFGSSSLPFAKNLLQIRPSRQSVPSRVGSVLRRRRTWSAAER